MKHTMRLVLFLCLSLASFTAASDDQFVFSGFNAANLTLDGAATITPNGLLELTNGAGNTIGHAFHPTPLHFRKSPNGPVQSFSVSFVFSILSEHPNRSADGIAFLVAASKNFSDALPAEYLGLLNNHDNGNASNHVFAVELDTIQNKEFMDMDDNHVGVDINSLHSSESKHAGFYEDKSGVFKNLMLVSHEVMQVWVDYDGEATQINITLAPLKVDKPVRPLMSVTYNLSTMLADPAYIGFSAATGGVPNTRHCVLGWSFGMDGPAPNIDITKLPKLPRLGAKASDHRMVLEIILPVATAVFISVVAVVLALFVRRRWRYAELREDWEVEFGPHRFSYKDLFDSTQGFSDKRLLGVGGFGKVYRGVLPSSRLEVAVKRVSHESRQGMKEFIAEVVSIGRLRHRNLVQLLGYCRRKGELLLVYDYMSNGSLDRYLHCEESEPTLDWARRFHIIKGVATGLLYLHEKWEKIVIHRDVKASNVLLDSEMNGRLGDFGLSRLYDHGTDTQTTHLVGTMGYLAPELVFTGKASPLTDVFAFGMFLLEVTCGRRPIDNNARDSQQMLVDWVIEHWKNGLLAKTVDARLHGSYSADEACLVLKLGLLCSHPIADERPTMRQAMRYLDGDAPLPELTPTELKKFSTAALMQSEGFDSYVVPCLSLSSVTSAGATSGGDRGQGGN